MEDWCLDCDSLWTGESPFGGLLVGGYWTTSPKTIGMYLGAWGWDFDERTSSVGA